MALISSACPMEEVSVVQNNTKERIRPAQKDKGKIICYNCGKTGHAKAACKSKPAEKFCKYCMIGGHLDDECRAQSATCNKCMKVGHFANRCPVMIEPATEANVVALRQSHGNTSNGKPSGRAKEVIMTEVEAKHSPDVVADTVSTNNMSNNLEQARKDYTEFEEKVKRSVLLSNLSPEVTSAVLKMALEQFGNVVNIEIIQNLNIPYDVPQCALVEMEDAGKARQVIKTMKDFPFMISGMPRPVTALPAKAEMFADRPALPGRKISFHWVDKNHPDFEVGGRLKKLCSRHVKESLALAKLQLEEEEKLGKQQEDMVFSNFKKYEMIELLLLDGVAARLANRYGIDLSEE